MTSELRPAEEVATEVATALTKKPANDRTLGEYLAAAVIEADRAPLLAEIERLRGVLKRWQYSGCPDCSGDCGSANPPVMCCIMEETRAALAGDSYDQ